jgi:hypothetical protein
MSWRMDKSSSLGMPMHAKKYPRSTSVKHYTTVLDSRPSLVGKSQYHHLNVGRQNFWRTVGRENLYIKTDCWSEMLKPFLSNDGSWKFRSSVRGIFIQFYLSLPPPPVGESIYYFILSIEVLMSYIFDQLYWALLCVQLGACFFFCIFNHDKTYHNNNYTKTIMTLRV